VDKGKLLKFMHIIRKDSNMQVKETKFFQTSYRHIVKFVNNNFKISAIIIVKPFMNVAL
jgi:hypothetical protein